MTASMVHARTARSHLPSRPRHPVEMRYACDPRRPTSGAHSSFTQSIANAVSRGIEVGWRVLKRKLVAGEGRTASHPIYSFLILFF